MGLIDPNEADGFYSPCNIEYQNNLNNDNNRNVPATDSDDSDAGSVHLQRQGKTQRGHRTRHCFSVSQENLANYGRKMGVRRRRRMDNLKYLMGLDEKDCEIETSSNSSVEPKATLFQQLLNNPEKLEVWNNFVESSEDEQNRILNYRGLHNIKEEKEEEDEEMEEVEHEPTSEESWVMILDKRSSHPAYSPKECYSRVDKSMRTLLKRRQLPMGMLCNLEREIVTFFTAWPSSVYICDISNSFERMLMHGLCQYMKLTAKSFDVDGSRKTQIENKMPNFRPPILLLTEYLQQNQRSL